MERLEKQMHQNVFKRIYIYTQEDTYRIHVTIKLTNENFQIGAFSLVYFIPSRRQMIVVFV